MKKGYSFTYPGIKEKQLDFKQAVRRVLNCGRYLVSAGFKNYRDYSFTSSNLSGIVEFPNGIRIDNNAFCSNSADRDSFLEKIVTEECEFKRHKIFSRDNWLFQRDKIVRNSFWGSGYTFYLSVVDTTRKKAWFPINLFLMTPTNFAFDYKIVLDKNFITEQDLKEFEVYKQDLERYARSGLGIRIKTPKKEEEKPKEEKPKRRFVNPFEVDLE